MKIIFLRMTASYNNYDRKQILLHSLLYTTRDEAPISFCLQWQIILTMQWLKVPLNVIIKQQLKSNDRCQESEKWLSQQNVQYPVPSKILFSSSPTDHLLCLLSASLTLFCFSNSASLCVWGRLPSIIVCAYTHPSKYCGC